MGRLRGVWPLLAETSTLDRAAPASVPRLTPARRAYLDELAAQERAERLDVLRYRTKPTGDMPAPASSAYLDARARIDRAVSDWTPELYTTATGLPLVARSATVDARVREGLDVIALYGPQLAELGSWVVIAGLVDALDQVTRSAERLAGVDPFEAPIRRQDCPACGQSLLRVRLESPDPGEWVVECRNPACLCPGWCQCGRPVRAPGRRHVWARDEWGPLTDRLTTHVDLDRLVMVTMTRYRAHNTGPLPRDRQTGEHET